MIVTRDGCHRVLCWHCSVVTVLCWHCSVVTEGCVNTVWLSQSVVLTLFGCHRVLCWHCSVVTTCVVLTLFGCHSVVLTLFGCHGVLCWHVSVVRVWCFLADRIDEYLRQQKASAALRIQSRWRGHVERSRWTRRQAVVRQVKAAILIQRSVRLLLADNILP